MRIRPPVGFVRRQKGYVMERYHIVKDGKIEASTATREAAIDLIREYQKLETHFCLRANFSIISGEEECVPYKKQGDKR
jgi:hypothetical protein